MQVLTRKILYDSRADTFRIYHLTDVHWGSRMLNERKLDAFIQRIADDPNGFVIGGGDYIDGIARKGDRRYAESAIAEWAWGEDDVIQCEIDYAVKKMAPIADKFLALASGNHEFEVEGHIDRNVYHEIVRGVARAAKVRTADLELGVEGFVQLRFRRGNSEETSGDGWECVIYTQHGAGGGRLPGGDALHLGRVLGDYDFDIGFVGHRHTHHMITKERARVTRDGKLRLKTSYACFSPSWLDPYLPPTRKGRIINTYAQRKALPPRPQGVSIFEVTPSQKKIVYIAEKL